MELARFEPKLAQIANLFRHAIWRRLSPASTSAVGLLLSTRTGHVDQKLSYRLEAWDAATGLAKWQQTLPSRHRVYAPLTYGKNGQQAHPSIVGRNVFLLSHITDALITLDLKIGQIERDPALYDFWIHSKTCAVPTASATGLYFRRDSCYMFDLPSRRAIDLTAVTRPGCWMSIIPAGGARPDAGGVVGLHVRIRSANLARAGARAVENTRQVTADGEMRADPVVTCVMLPITSSAFRNTFLTRDCVGSKAQEWLPKELPFSRGRLGNQRSVYPSQVSKRVALTRMGRTQKGSISPSQRERERPSG